MVQKGESTAQRFINAYNQIDYALRGQYNFKSNISFTDLVRRCSSLNSVVREHEDDLIAYARLRNAIVHSAADYIIAEPHEEVVTALEKIARIVTTPPLALDALKRQDVATIQGSLTLREWLIEKAKNEYSNLPVCKNGMILGVMFFQNYVAALAKFLTERRSVDEFIDNTTVEEFLLEYPSQDRQYQITGAKITIEQVLKLFHDNKKLICILITKNGNALEPILRYITRADIMDLMKVVEKY
jgi:hypothetical protein